MASIIDHRHRARSRAVVIVALVLTALGVAPPSAQAAFPGQNGSIAFDSRQTGIGTGSTTPDIYTMPAEGAVRTRLTTDAQYDTEPAFSPNGLKIAFVSSRTFDREIYTMDAADANGDGNGDNLVRLTNSSGNAVQLTDDVQPQFSPNGQRIIFTSRRDGNREIYTMDAADANGDGNGDNLVRVTNNTVDDLQPKFSPDGSKIVFVRGSAVYSMKADGTGVTNLVSNAVSPDFSPNGTKIVFVKSDGIYVMNADGSGQSRLLLLAGAEGSPVFSPDGLQIAYTRTDTVRVEFGVSTRENKEIYTMNADGTGSQNRSLYPTADEGSASWGAKPGTTDTSPPQTTITSGPSGTTNDNTPTFEFTSSEAGSSFECRVDAAAFASCTSPHTTAPLADGPHTFEVRATDVAGNTDGSPASRAFTVNTAGSSDTTPPQTTISSGPDGATNDNTPTFEFSSNEQSSTFQCRVDSQPFASCSSPHTTTQLGDGAHTFEVRATDAAGNADPTPASRTFTVDTAAPETTISSGPSGTTNDKSPSFSYTSSEPDGASFECKLDGPGATTGSYADCPSPKAYSSLADGNYVFSVRATDAAGNPDPSPASRTFTVDSSAPADTTPPQTTIGSGPANTTADTTPTFAFRSSEANSTFSCRLDSQPFAPCSSPHTTAALSPGRHTFSVFATDPAGNADPTPATRTFTVSAPPAPPRRPAAPPARPPAPDASDPLISGLSFRPGRFRAARSGPSIAAKGARVSYRLSEPASVSFRVERVLAGRRAGRRCVKPRRSTRRARRCTRYQTLRGSFTHRGKTGANTLRFSGRLRGRKLRPGRYRLSAVASDAAGNRSKPRRTSFRVRR